MYEREGDTKERGRRERGGRERERGRERELDSVCVWQGLQYTSCSTQVAVHKFAVQRWCLLTAHSMVGAV